MSAQYCRYCSYMVCGDANYCCVRKRTYSDEYIKRTNKCKLFKPNPIDALGENPKGYRPRMDSVVHIDGEDIDDLYRQVCLFEAWTVTKK